MLGRCPPDAHPAHELPGQGHVHFVTIGGEGAIGADIAADDRAAAQLAHRIHRQIVHRAAVHQHLALVDDRRQHAGNCDGGTQPEPQQSAPVHLGMTRGQVGGHAEESQRQILDRDVAEVVRSSVLTLRPETSETNGRV